MDLFRSGEDILNRLKSDRAAEGVFRSKIIDISSDLVRQGENGLD